MKAVYIKEFGNNFDGLELRETGEPPVPSHGEVIVRVHAAGVNRADLLQAMGRYPPPPGFSVNLPGLEFAGEIALIGPDVVGWNLGDRVFGITAGEAQAQFLTVDHRLLMKIPERITYHEAAAIPEAFITAHDSVFIQGALKKDDVLLIHAVGSAVGLAALQMAKLHGSFVIGTSRTEHKLKRSSDLGLDAGFKVEKTDAIATNVLEKSERHGADVILDLVGAAYFEQNLACLAQRGRLLLVGLSSGAHAEFNLAAALNKRAKIIGTVMRGRSVREKAQASLSFRDHGMELLSSGKLRANLDRVFAAKDVRTAYKYVASNRNFGKVVLDLSS